MPRHFASSRVKIMLSGHLPLKFSRGAVYHKGLFQATEMQIVISQSLLYPHRVTDTIHLGKLNQTIHSKPNQTYNFLKGIS